MGFQSTNGIRHEQLESLTWIAQKLHIELSLKTPKSWDGGIRATDRKPGATKTMTVTDGP